MDKCNRKSKGGSKVCRKPKGHVTYGDKVHSDGVWSWGGYR